MAWDRKRVAGTIGLVALALALGPWTGAQAGAQAPVAPPVWAVQLGWTDSGQAWSESTFASLQAEGINRAEINLSWSDIEPSPGVFDFSLLDADLANAGAAGIQIIPLFWQSVWAGNPAPWITTFDVASNGQQAAMPSWWDPTERQEYFTYVTTTIAHIRNNPGFGGAFLDYGWLDAMWGVPPNAGSAPDDINGYAPADVARFHQWLPTRYASLASFNQEYRTSYASWDQVPAATPAQPLFQVYQAFRIWSVKETYGELTGLVRAETGAPLYYYIGGELGQAIAYGNLPDIFFSLAKEYHAIVVLDDANVTGLSVLYASLAQAYHVPVLTEWTPSAPVQNALAPEAAQWLAHTGLASPQLEGLDFFIYQGGPEYDAGFPIYTRWIHAFAQVQGSYPTAPVALYVNFDPAFGDNADATTNPFSLSYAFARVSDITQTIEGAWRATRVPFAVVTNQEVRDGAVSLAHYRAVLPVNGMDASLRQYAGQGGRILNGWNQLADFAHPFASLSPAEPLVEITPTVDRATRQAWLSLAEVSPRWDYTGSLTVRYANLGLPSGSYHLVDAETGQPVPSQATRSQLCAPLSMTGGDLALWELAPGPGPRTTCPSTPTPTPPVATATADAPDDLAFLALHTFSQGSDGNLQPVTQDGVPAVATCTEAECHTVPVGAYMYLQLNPRNAVYNHRSVQVTVTYWASPGQGFTVQYDGLGGMYEQTQQAMSPGSSQWETTTLKLPDARFSEGENLDADLRLSAADPSQPLIVRQVTVSAQG